jgi:hypothetical protein
MPMPEKGKWKPYNVKAIINNVKLVFKNRDITKLNGPTYKFITLHMGFIAHYSLYGFQDSYQDIEKFAKRLQTSEYSDDHGYTLQRADRQGSDRDFDQWYGAAYNKSIAEAIRGIVEIARKYYPGTEGTRPMFDPGATAFYRTYAEPLTAPPPKRKRKSPGRRVGPKAQVKGLR